MENMSNMKRAYDSDIWQSVEKKSSFPYISFCATMQKSEPEKYNFVVHVECIALNVLRMEVSLV